MQEIHWFKSSTFDRAVETTFGERASQEWPSVSVTEDRGFEFHLPDHSCFDDGGVADLADAPVLGTGSFGRVGSTPTAPTIRTVPGNSSVGRALHLGCRGRRFEACFPDQLGRCAEM